MTEYTQAKAIERATAEWLVSFLQTFDAGDKVRKSVDGIILITEDTKPLPRHQAQIVQRCVSTILEHAPKPETALAADDVIAAQVAGVMRGVERATYAGLPHPIQGIPAHRMDPGMVDAAIDSVTPLILDLAQGKHALPEM